jgi:hypothetical protein
MQLPKLKNNELINKIIKRGMTLQSKLQDCPNNPKPCEEENPQSLWASFKKDVVKTTKKNCFESQGKLRRKIKKIKGDLKTLQGTWTMASGQMKCTW